ncbi:hypothetical protein [Paracoccus spongiarum]|uniref:DNA-binding protein n=1 Tax=Paracoccus spongiarum TaxID=3064387 RepID=A0ABT9J7K6_9RHOB|nr:hypothetical protein [Paracoccus sp. 2205BS29-5]MDP5305771.1 hypothetical protein [Paracoccus sp. 2205BS29-5]
MSNKQSQSQSDKFKDLAREVKADEDEAAFDQVLGRIAKNKPTDGAQTPDRTPKPKR